MAIETIEGVWQETLFYHYDVTADVLYVRLCSRLGEPVYGEEDENGFHLMRSQADDALVGLSVIGYWRLFGANLTPTDGRTDWRELFEDSVAELGEPLIAA